MKEGFTMFETRYDPEHLLFHNPVTIDAVKYRPSDFDTHEPEIVSMHICAVGTAPADKWIANCHDDIVCDFTKLTTAFPPTDYGVAIYGHAFATFHLRTNNINEKYIEVRIND